MEQISIVSKNFSAIKVDRNPEYGRFQRMSIALPENEGSHIQTITNDPKQTYEERYKLIEDILSETNCCQGYFFDQENNMNYRYLYLEVCRGTLDSYIREESPKQTFKWTILQDLCSQLVGSMTWLHQQNIFHDGNLNPRNILVKFSDHNQTKLKLMVLDSLNPFINLDIVYAKSWSSFPTYLDVDSEEKSIRKDISSVAILVYFIQSSGSHPFQLGSDFRDNFTAIERNIKQTQWDVNDQEALSKPCFCNQGSQCADVRNVFACKYRSWVNSLAQDWTQHVLKGLDDKNSQSYTNQSLSKLGEHPFFWKTSRILTFIEKSWNYLNEANDETKKINFGWMKSKIQSNQQTTKPKKGRNAKHGGLIKQPWDIAGFFSKISIDYGNITDYLHGRKSAMSKPCEENFYWLLRQIRNKSCHWNDEANSIASTEARKDLEDINFLIPHNNNPAMEVHPTKYCLFWMVNFPSLLLYTWKELKDHVKLD